MNIEIPFNKWSLKKLENGIKYATSRNKKYGEVGDTFNVNGSKYQLTVVTKLPLWFIAFHLHKTEGCKRPIDFENIWKEIHPKKGWKDTQVVWYHHFVEI